MAYQLNGSLTTDKRTVDDEQTWDAQSDWEAYQSANQVEIANGSVQLAEFTVRESEADSKLLHRWYLSEDSPPFVDQVGSADSTSVTGTEQVTGEFVDGAARSGDGTDDAVQTTTWGSFGSSMDTDYALAFSVSSATQDAVLGVTNSGGNASQSLGVRLDNAYDGSSGTLTFAIRDDTSDPGGFTSVESSTDLTGGGPYRVVINKTGNTAADIGVWVNQADDGASTNRDQCGTNFVDFDEPVPLFANNARGTLELFNGGVLDDVCVFGNSLTQSEIESYQNPWA